MRRYIYVGRPLRGVHTACVAQPTFAPKGDDMATTTKHTEAQIYRQANHRRKTNRRHMSAISCCVIVVATLATTIGFAAPADASFATCHAPLRTNRGVAHVTHRSPRASKSVAAACIVRADNLTGSTTKPVSLTVSVIDQNPSDQLCTFAQVWTYSQPTDTRYAGIYNLDKFQTSPQCSSNAVQLTLPTRTRFYSSNSNYDLPGRFASMALRACVVPRGTYTSSDGTCGGWTTWWLAGDRVYTSAPTPPPNASGNQISTR